MNITLDKSLSVQLNVLLFSSINWLVSYRKLDTKRRLGSVVLECLFFLLCQRFDSTENFFFFFRGSQFYRQRVWAVAD